METPPRHKQAPAGTESSAGRASWLPSGGRLAIAVLLALAGVAGLWLLWAPSVPETELAVASTSPPLLPPAAAPTVAATPSGPPAPTTAPAPEGDADPTPDLRSYVARGENPTMGQVIERLHQRGIYSGLGAFSPPGTSPPLVGLAVPEDFVLPKGYVRHHQTTDDGQRIEAILMFAPDYNVAGMPANRVVPPELAPPGLPIRRIVIPPPTDPTAAVR